MASILSAFGQDRCEQTRELFRPSGKIDRLIAALAGDCKWKIAQRSDNTFNELGMVWKGWTCVDRSWSHLDPNSSKVVPLFRIAIHLLM